MVEGGPNVSSFPAMTLLAASYWFRKMASVEEFSTLHTPCLVRPLTLFKSLLIHVELLDTHMDPTDIEEHLVVD